MSIFQLIRLVLSAVLALGVFCLARKKLKSKKILWAAAAAAWIIFDIALCETPFENRKMKGDMWTWIVLYSS